MNELKKAINNLVDGPGPLVFRATVLSVDKNDTTCNVKVVSSNAVLQDVKLKPVTSDGDLTQLGLIIYPAIDSFVNVAYLNDDNDDACVIDCTIIESIALNTSTALSLLLTSDGKINLNAVQMTFNQGKNGGIPLLNPLTSVILKLQQQVNALINAFSIHIHPVAGTSTGPTVTPAPPVNAQLIKPADIANKTITQ